MRDMKTWGAALLALSFLASCGGGSGGGSGSVGAGAGPGTPQGSGGGGSGGSSDSTMTMSCVDGAGFHCSGGSLIRVDNGIGLTRSGVQAYGRSTSDLANPNLNKTGASGFSLVTQPPGLAELRTARDASGTVTRVAVMLSSLGLSWDGTTERPLIIETFNPSQGRVELDASGALVDRPLPSHTDRSFYDYDFATRGRNATQRHYANNRYFPRDFPARDCPYASQPPYCEMETIGLQPTSGDWRSGGVRPDRVFAQRLHGDGDVHAGDGPPGPNGEPTYIEGGTGPGVPFPGSKGYRELSHWNFQYSNLAAWLTQDTVLIMEWGGGDEHNKNRRGMVAYGAVTDPAAVPSSGTSTYRGRVSGYYAVNATEDPAFFEGEATVSVNFASRAATVTVASGPANFTVTTTMGAAGDPTANYFTGPVSASSNGMSGGLSGRYFGPILTSGSTAGPAEIGGVFTLGRDGSGQALVAGFLGRKQ